MITSEDTVSTSGCILRVKYVYEILKYSKIINDILYVYTYVPELNNGNFWWDCFGEYVFWYMVIQIFVLSLY